MISHERRCIFVHQRKCAGMAVISALGVDRHDPDFHFANDGILSPEWTDQADLVDRYFTFAVVRNPWDRLVSGWKYCRTTRDRSIVSVLRRPPRKGHDYRHVTRSQSETIFGPDGTLAVDHLIRYERLDEGFAEVCEMLGVAGIPLPRANIGERPPHDDVFDATARRLSERRYHEDIDRLGYSF